MRITKNGFYKLSEILSPFFKGSTLEVGKGEGLKPVEIIIESNLIISIFDDLNFSSFSIKGSTLEVGKGDGLFINIGENSKVEIFGVLENVSDFNMKVVQEQENSDLKLNYLILSKNISPLQGGDAGKAEGGKISTKIESVLKADFVKSDMKIISIVGKKGFVDLDGIIKIEDGIKKVDGNLSEENIFLGDDGQVKGIPTLLVASSDVKASHSCKMERISDEKLFYLRSRGLKRENALNMIIEAKIENLFSCLRMYDKDFYEKTLENILEKI